MQVWLDENRLPKADKIQNIKNLEDGIAKASAGELGRSPAEPALPLPLDEPIKINPEHQGNNKANEASAGMEEKHHETAGAPLDIAFEKPQSYQQCSLALE